MHQFSLLVAAVAMAVAEGGRPRGGGLAFAGGSAPLLGGTGPLCASGGATRGRSTGRPGGALALSAEAQGGAGTRRGAISLAFAAGAALLGGDGARAAGGSGPETVDGPALDKTAIRPGAPTINRNRISITGNARGADKVMETPKDAKQLTKTYNRTESGVFFKVLKEGEGETPKAGDQLEVNYIGAICEVDRDGEYDCAPRTGTVEIYPNIPQGIAADSPRYDSSFDRGRPLRMTFGKAQVSLGLEEALTDMRPGGSKMIFLVPELSLSCPKGRVCVPEITSDERICMLVELVSVNGVGAKGVAAPDTGTPAAAVARPTGRKRVVPLLFGEKKKSEPAAKAAEGAGGAGGE